MKSFIEKALHQRIELSEYNKLEKLPLIFKANYEINTMDIGNQHCLLVRPKSENGLALLRKQQKRLEQLTGQYCVLYLKKMNYYSRDKMLEEGIPFIWEGRQIYMPFLGVLLNHNESREIKPCNRISFLTQKLLLLALYEQWEGMTVTKAAQCLGVSKMSITRCFDEIESLDIPVLEKRGRTRMVAGVSDRKKMWEIIRPFMRSPLVQEYQLAHNITQNLIKSGFSALAEYSMISDNMYPTYAVHKMDLNDYSIKKRKQIPKGEEPGCVVQELGYLIPFKDGMTIDPLTVYLLLEDEKEEPRVEKALEEMLEEYVW